MGFYKVPFCFNCAILEFSIVQKGNDVIIQLLAVVLSQLSSHFRSSRPNRLFFVFVLNVQLWYLSQWAKTYNSNNVAGIFLQFCYLQLKAIWNIFNSQLKWMSKNLKVDYAILKIFKACYKCKRYFSTISTYFSQLIPCILTFLLSKQGKCVRDS